MRKPKEIVLFDNFENYGTELFEEIKKDLINTTADEVTDTRVWEEISGMQRYDYEEMIEVLKRAEDAHGNRKWVVCGTSGSWMGNYHATQIYEDVDEMLREITKDCDYIRVALEEGCLTIKAAHHDGTHCFRCKILTKSGMNAYEKWYYEERSKWKNYSEYKMYRHLFDYKSETPKIEKYLCI